MQLLSFLLSSRVTVCLWLLIYRLRCVGSKNDQRIASGPAPELAGMSTRSRGARGNNWILSVLYCPGNDREREKVPGASRYSNYWLVMDRLVPETGMLNIDSKLHVPGL